MTPFLLFLYVVAFGFGLIVTSAAAGAAFFLVRGWLEDLRRSEPEA
jgi:hypothetical protein